MYMLTWSAKLVKGTVDPDTNEFTQTDEVSEYSNFVTFDSVKLVRNVGDLVGQQVFNKLAEDNNL